MLYKSTNRAERYHVKRHLTAESEFKALIYDPKMLKPQSNTFQKTLKNMLMGFASPLILDHWICLHLFSVVLESQPNPWAHIVLRLQDSEKEVWTGQRVISKLPIQEGDTGNKDHSCPAPHLPWMDPISVLCLLPPDWTKAVVEVTVFWGKGRGTQGERAGTSQKESDSWT